jgi:hypothetical protein
MIDEMVAAGKSEQDSVTLSAAIASDFQRDDCAPGSCLVVHQDHALLNDWPSIGVGVPRRATVPLVIHAPWLMQWSLNQGEEKRGPACISAILFNPPVMTRCFAVSGPLCSMVAILETKSRA